MVENIIQVKRGIKICANVNVKIQQNMYAKKIKFGILKHVFLKLIDIQTVLMLI